MRFLFTSASSPPALALARALAAEGHVVYAADKERIWGTAPARYSRAYTHFYRLDAPSDLIALCKTVRDEMDVVIPFGHVPSHIRRTLEETGVNITGRTLLHDNLEFSDFVRDNVLSRADPRPSVVKIPAAFTIHARAEIAEILGQYPETTFSLQPGPYFDFDDEDTLVGLDSPTASTSSTAFDTYEQQLVISCAALSDDMVGIIENLPISETRSYRMVEIIEGGIKYSAHAFVTAGELRTFVVTADRGANHDAVIIPVSQPLFNIFYEFTGRFVHALYDGRHDSMLEGQFEQDRRSFTGHLSLHFCVRDEIRENGDFVRKITATSCANEPHASIALLCSTSLARRQLAEAYMQTIPSRKKCLAILSTTSTSWGLYSAPTIANTLAHIVTTFAPLDRNWWTGVSRIIITCGVKILCFQEEMWDMRDPAPALCLWLGLLAANIGKRPWLRIGGTLLLSKGQRMLYYFSNSRLGRMMKTLSAIALYICYFWVGVLLQMRPA